MAKSPETAGVGGGNNLLIMFHEFTHERVSVVKLIFSLLLVMKLTFYYKNSSQQLEVNIIQILLFDVHSNLKLTSFNSFCLVHFLFHVYQFNFFCHLTALFLFLFSDFFFYLFIFCFVLFCFVLCFFIIIIITIIKFLLTNFMHRYAYCINKYRRSDIGVYQQT